MSTTLIPLAVPAIYAKFGAPPSARNGFVLRKSPHRSKKQEHTERSSAIRLRTINVLKASAIPTPPLNGWASRSCMVGAGLAPALKLLIALLHACMERILLYLSW